jgi:acyl carrier protein
MLEQEIFERTRKIIAEEKRVPLERISMTTTFAELGIDSLEGAGIIFALEGEFNISIPDEAMGRIRDVGQIVNGIEQLLC